MNGHRGTRLVTVVLLMAVLFGCDALAAPPGSAPLRFRDPVFTAVTRTNGLAYGTAVDRHTGQTVTLDFDLYQPTGDTSTSRPLIIWIHGGSFTSLDRTSPELVDEATTFGLQGYVSASIDYRLSPTGCTQVDQECELAIEDAIADAQLAVRYFRSHAAQYGIDPHRIAVGGSSAGAITALDVGYRAPVPADAGYPGVSSSVNAAVSISGAAIITSWVGQGDAAALDFHDTTDPLVPYPWATATQTAAQQADVPYYEVSWAETGHVPYVQHRAEILTDETNFLYNILDLTHWTG